MVPFCLNLCCFVLYCFIFEWSVLLSFVLLCTVVFSFISIFMCWFVSSCELYCSV